MATESNKSGDRLRERMYRFYADFHRYYTTNAYFQVISQTHPDRFTAYILERVGEEDRALGPGAWLQSVLR